MAGKFYTKHLEFPLGGIDENFSYLRQRGNNQSPTEQTTANAQNVRGIDPSTGRARGGQRSGLSKYLSTAHSANSIQEIGHLVAAQAISGGTIRSTTRYAIAGGTFKTFTSSAFSTPTGGSSAFSSTAPVVFTVPAFGYVFGVDGTNTKAYTLSTDTVANWTATADEGTVPSNSRICELYRGRLLLSGVSTDPHNWFMSKVADPFNWDYSEDCVTAAVAGNNSDVGELDDIVQGIAPISQNMALFGGDHSLFWLSGDPMQGGSFQRISDSIGMAFGRAWCLDPSGAVWFWGSRGGLYRIPSNGYPEKVSANRIDKSLSDIDLSTHLVRLAYNDRDLGVHIFITPTTSAATTHYFYDLKNGAFWKDVFADNDHSPLAIHVLDGDAPGDRVMLLGGRDGYIRVWDADADDDDGTAIDSYVWLGPIRLRGSLRAFQLWQMQATLGSDSDNVTWELYRGDTPESALDATAWHTGTWQGGRNRPDLRRALGDSMYLRLRNNTAAERWAFEQVELEMREVGSTAQRGL